MFAARPEQQAQDQRSDPRRTSTASARSQCSPPDPNSKHRIRGVIPAGPQLQALAGSQCSPPDLHRNFRIRAFPADLHRELLRVPHRTSTTKNIRYTSQKECQKIYQIHMPERMSKFCQNERLKRCQKIECQNRSQIECLKECQNKYHAESMSV